MDYVEHLIGILLLHLLVQHSPVMRKKDNFKKKTNDRLLPEPNFKFRHFEEMSSGIAMEMFNRLPKRPLKP